MLTPPLESASGFLGQLRYFSPRSQSRNLFFVPLASPLIAVRPDERPSAAEVSLNLTGARTGSTLGGQAMLGRIPAAMRCLCFLLVTAIPLHALAQDERPVPPLPIGARQETARDHAH